MIREKSNEKISPGFRINMKFNCGSGPIEILHETFSLLDKIFRVTIHAYVALGHIQREEKSFTTVKPQIPISVLTVVGNPRTGNSRNRDEQTTIFFVENFFQRKLIFDQKNFRYGVFDEKNFRPKKF
jgi:hypothetical protein